MTDTPKNKYVGIYKGKRGECNASTKFIAQEILATFLGAKHGYDVAVALTEKDGKQVTHVADF